MTDPIDRAVMQLELDLNQLKVHFEMFITGRERVPPLQKITAFEKSLNRLAFEANKRTQSKFKLANLRARFTSFKSLWMRQLERKESGRQPQPLKGRRQAPPEAAPKPDKGLLHEEYNRALEEVGDKRRVSETQLNATIEHQRSKLATKYPGKEFEFQVSVRDGKVKLKALPK